MSDGGAGERELPPGWAWAKVGEVLVEVRNGISTKPDAEHGLRILRISAVRPSRLDLGDVRYLPSYKEEFRTYELRNGDLLFTRYNGNRELVGACAQVRGLVEPTVYPDKLIRGRVDASVGDAGYVELVAGHGATRAFIDAKSKTAAGQVGISGADLREAPLPLPPLAEQRRIVAKLDDLLAHSRRARDALAEIPALLERYRQAVLAAAFRGELTAEWRANRPDAERSAWEHRPLRELTSRITSGSRAWSKFYDRGDATFVLAQNVRDDGLDLSTTQRVDPPVNDPERERTRIQRGDVLVTIVGANTGDCCWVRDDLIEHYVCQSVALIRPVAADLAPWIAAVIQHAVQEGGALAGAMYGAARPHLGLEHLRDLSIPLAPPAEVTVHGVV